MWVMPTSFALCTRDSSYGVRFPGALRAASSNSCRVAIVLTFRLGAPYMVRYQMYDTRPVGVCMAVVYHIAGLWGILPHGAVRVAAGGLRYPATPAKYARPVGRLRRLGRLGSLANSYWYQGNRAPGYAAKLR